MLLDRRNGEPLRSTSWRDPVNLAKMPAHVVPLCLDIADAFDAIERRAS